MDRGDLAKGANMAKRAKPVDLVVWEERGGSTEPGWFYRFADELHGTAYGPYRTRAGARAGGRRRAAREERERQARGPGGPAARAANGGAR